MRSDEKRAVSRVVRDGGRPRCRGRASQPVQHGEEAAFGFVLDAESGELGRPGVALVEALMERLHFF